VTVFADPSVEFGLQFTAAAAPSGKPALAAERSREPEAAPAADASAEVVALDRFRKK
jgi:hypothetical protein